MARPLRALTARGWQEGREGEKPGIRVEVCSTAVWSGSSIDLPMQETALDNQVFEASSGAQNPAPPQTPLWGQGPPAY